MKLNECEYDLETKFVEGCDPCRRSRFTRRVPIRFGPFTLYVTYTYEVLNCPMGFTGGDLLYVLSLLPKEEQEVEIVQRSKYERALHEQRSVESEFENEFMHTLRNEVSSSQDVNTALSVETGLHFFAVDVNTSASASASAHFAQSVFSETVTKSAIKVSNHYEIAVDVKTEVESQYRSLRRIVNPSECRVVTYFFKQLNKKFSLKILLVGIRFDLVQKLSDIHAAVRPYHVVEPRFTTSVVQPTTIPNENPRQAHAFKTEANADRASASSTAVPTMQSAAVNAYRVLEYRETDVAKELDAAALLVKLESLKLDTEQTKKIQVTVAEISGGKESQPGFVVYSTEYCVRTNSVVAEPKVSHCSICTCDECECDDESTDAIRALETEKLKTEIELLRKQIEKA